MQMTHLVIVINNLQLDCEYNLFWIEMCFKLEFIESLKFIAVALMMRAALV